MTAAVTYLEEKTYSLDAAIRQAILDGEDFPDGVVARVVREMPPTEVDRILTNLVRNEVKSMNARMRHTPTKAPSPFEKEHRSTRGTHKAVLFEGWRVRRESMWRVPDGTLVPWTELTYEQLEYIAADRRKRADDLNAVAREVDSWRFLLTEYDVRKLGELPIEVQRKALVD